MVGTFMHKVLLAAVGFLAFGAFSAAEAGVVVKVSKSRQTMYVYVDGYLQHVWPVSTARNGYSTPNGVYHPTALDPYHRSSRYHNSPMPHSIFFRGGYAIHGSYDVGRLGRPASHGCIRLDPRHASELYGLVRTSGGTRIVVSR
jgi:lipoprotein-anchoring transpeptidase ErfK/SrfK